MQLAISRELHAYWDALRAGRSAPERNDIEPGAIRAILADTFVLDFDKESGFPFRIVGSRANSLFLRELRGLSFLEIWREADREQVRAALDSVANETRPYLLRAEARPPGVETAEIETTLLPLRHNGSTRSRVLGCLALKSTPHWLGLIDAGPALLLSRRPFDPTRSTETETTAPAADTHDSVGDVRTRQGAKYFGARERRKT
jgi:hypothetical protein